MSGNLKSHRKLFVSRTNFLQRAGIRPFVPWDKYYAGNRLYFEILVWHKRRKDIFSREFAELAYATLDSWGMHRRKAKLKKFNDFFKNINKHEDEISQLRNVRIEHLTSEKKELATDLFADFNVMSSSTQLVGASKTLHYYLPNLSPPIDRQYTLRRLRWEGYYPFDETGFYKEMLKWCNTLCKDFNITQKDQRYSEFDHASVAVPIPKIIDDAIMSK